ncbi:MAG TPA: hypothetical protein DHW02_05540 [Ktedonobacter sp.]|nr:hypothetical protein [Ktedonobacter sp.]
MACAMQLNDEVRVAGYWWSLAPDTVLPLSHGGTCCVLFSGYHGSSAGPDVRDVVLLFDTPDGKGSERCVGDVEFHIRASDWVTHQHHTDSRYNNVLLHVVLLCDTPLPTIRQDGTVVPVCSLFDTTSSLSYSSPSHIQQKVEQVVYPCHNAMSQRNEVEREQLLQRAGLLRFEQKRDAFVEGIRACAEGKYHFCLIPALAEGLAYGRDRTFFRGVALHLLELSHEIPEPLGRATSPSPLDASRLAVISTLVAQGTSLWTSLRRVFEENTGTGDVTLQALQAWLSERGIRPSRADIMLCNVVLPFAAAVALIERNEQLAQLALHIYKMHPGLASNRVTRMMTAQLRLTTEPHGACSQQGLHYIYQQTCREKLCDACVAGREQL